MRTMDRVVSTEPITEAEWEALSDPVGGRYEIIGGVLIMNPSQTADHSRYNEDLADLIRWALAHADDPALREYEVTIDVEWRTVEGTIVSEAPRGDILVSTGVDQHKGIHLEQPLLVVEVWSPSTRPATKRNRRRMWRGRQLSHYWEVNLGASADETNVSVYELINNHQFPVAAATGSETLTVSEPFALNLRPDNIRGWAHRQILAADAASTRAEAEAARAEAEAARAEAEAARAEAEAARAEAEAARADEAVRRAEAAEAALRQLRRQRPNPH